LHLVINVVRRGIIDEGDSVMVHESAMGKKLFAIPTGGNVNSARFSPDGKRLVVDSTMGHGADSKSELTTWDPATGQKLASEALGQIRVHFGDETLSPDGKWIVYQGFQRGELAVRKASSNRLVFSKAQSFRKVVFSPDSKCLAAISTDRVNVWSVATGKVVFPALKIPHVADVAFSPDGKHIVTAGAEPALKIWDATTGAGLRPLEEDTDVLSLVAFSRDGKTLATAGAYRTVKLWDMAALAEKLDPSR
jgi:WD40 repeat protein